MQPLHQASIRYGYATNGLSQRLILNLYLFISKIRLILIYMILIAKYPFLKTCLCCEVFWGGYILQPSGKGARVENLCKPRLVYMF